MDLTRSEYLLVYNVYDVIIDGGKDFSLNEYSFNFDIVLSMYTYFNLLFVDINGNKIIMYQSTSLNSGERHTLLRLDDFEERNNIIIIIDDIFIFFVFLYFDYNVLDYDL